MSCSVLPRLGHDEVDVIRSARPEGKRYRHRNKGFKNNKSVAFMNIPDGKGASRFRSSRSGYEPILHGGQP